MMVKMIDVECGLLCSLVGGCQFWRNVSPPSLGHIHSCEMLVTTCKITLHHDPEDYNQQCSATFILPVCNSILNSTIHEDLGTFYLHFFKYQMD
jgi:hypothetical protein